MAKFRPEQIEVSTGTTDNDTVTTKGYVDDKVAPENTWDRNDVGTPFLYPANTGDKVHLNDVESALFTNADIQIFRNSAGDMTFWSASAVASVDSDLNLVRSRGTIASPAAVQDGDAIGNFNMVGASSASNFNNGAEITGEINGAVSAGALPCDMLFKVNAGGGATTERMRLVKDGTLKVDQIAELTGSAGVTIEDLLHLDEAIQGNNLTLTAASGTLALDSATALTIQSDSSYTINPDQANADITILSPASANLMFFDMGNDRIGILNAAPSVELDVTGSGKFSVNCTGGNVTLTGNTINTSSGDLNLNSFSNDIFIQNARPSTLQFPAGTQVNNIVTGVGSLSTDNMLATAKAIFDDFAFLGGKIGGQTLSGGFGLNENLDLQSTFAATKGAVRIRDGSDFEFVGSGTGVFKVEENADAKIYLGRSMISSPTTDVAYWSHYDTGDSNTDYAIKQLSSGRTSVNAASGQLLGLAINNVSQVNISATTTSILGGQQVKRTASAGDYNPSALTTDYLIAITDTTAPRAVTISTEDIQSGSTSNPRIFIVKDESGGAGSNSITVSGESGTIDGAANVAIAQNYAALTIYADGTNLFIY